MINVLHVLSVVSSTENNITLWFDNPFSNTDYSVSICPVSFPRAWTNVRWKVGGKTTQNFTITTYGENGYQGEGWFDIVVIGY